MELQSAGNRNSTVCKDPQRLNVKYLNSIVETYSTGEDKEKVHTKDKLKGLKSKADKIRVKKKTRLTKAERLKYKMSDGLGQVLIGLILGDVNMRRY